MPLPARAHGVPARLCWSVTQRARLQAALCDMPTTIKAMLLGRHAAQDRVERGRALPIAQPASASVIELARPSLRLLLQAGAGRRRRQLGSGASAGRGARGCAVAAARHVHGAGACDCQRGTGGTVILERQPRAASPAAGRAAAHAAGEFEFWVGQLCRCSVPPGRGCGEGPAAAQAGFQDAY